MTAFSIGRFGEETVGQARARVCRRIAWTAGVTAAVLLLALQAAAFLAVLHAGLPTREALLAGCVPLGGPVYGGVQLALQGDSLWAPLALLLVPALAAVVVAIVYGVAARRSRWHEEGEEPETEMEAESDDLLPAVAITPVALRPATPPQATTTVETAALTQSAASQKAADPQPTPATTVAPVAVKPAATAPTRPIPAAPKADASPETAVVDPELRQAQAEYEAARARIADILKQK